MIVEKLGAFECAGNVIRCKGGGGGLRKVYIQYSGGMTSLLEYQNGCGERWNSCGVSVGCDICSHEHNLISRERIVMKFGTGDFF